MKCPGSFLKGLFARTAELNPDVESELFSPNSIVFNAKIQEREFRKNSMNKNLMFYSQSQLY